MGIVRDVNFKITGQVGDDYKVDEHRILKAELEVVCAKHGVYLEEC